MKEEMRTSDFWVAAYVISRGGEFIRLEKNPARPDQTIVVLEGENLKALAQEYMVNGRIGIRSFKECYLGLKSSLFGKIQNTDFTRKKINGKKRIFKTRKR